MGTFNKWPSQRAGFVAGKPWLSLIPVDIKRVEKSQVGFLMSATYLKCGQAENRLASRDYECRGHNLSLPKALHFRCQSQLERRRRYIARNYTRRARIPAETYTDGARVRNEKKNHKNKGGTMKSIMRRSNIILSFLTLQQRMKPL